jgi:nucleoside-diphosphate-sugar epimerase
VMNIGKAERDLGFTPRTSFHEGIRAYCVHAGLI